MKIYDSKADKVIDVAPGLGASMLKYNNVKDGGRYGEAKEVAEKPKPKKRTKKAEAPKEEPKTREKTQD